MTLTYPMGGALAGNDYVFFQHFEYASNRSGRANPPSTGAQIQLYMPTNTANVSNQNKWGHKSMGEGALGGFYLDLAHTAGAENPDSAMRQIQEILGDKTRGIDFKGIGYQLGITAAAGMLNMSPSAVTQMGQGKVFNPNIELLYEAPAPRSFGFDFTFIPRNAAEAAVVNKIILEFKKWSSPAGDSGGAMYKVPQIWQCTYVSGGRTDVMNRFKPAALSGISVVANPNANMHATYTDGMPIETAIKLTFMEVDVILREDHEAVGGQGY